jgi:3-isopropylmalate/(R)-2-methylmalate dehydratase small subunit
MKLEGKAWVFGDSLAATDIVSAQYDKAGMSRDYAECRRHLMEDVDPAFTSAVQPGDIVIAGESLGRGHAHYYTAAVMACREAGISALLCESVNALFQRGAIDLGLLTWAFPGITSFARTGDRIEIDLATGSATNHTTGAMRQFRPVSELIMSISAAGGSLDWALERVGAAA